MPWVNGQMANSMRRTLVHAVPSPMIVSACHRTKFSIAQSLEAIISSTGRKHLTALEQRAPAGGRRGGGGGTRHRRVICPDITTVLHFGSGIDSSAAARGDVQNKTRKGRCAAYESWSGRATSQVSQQPGDLAEARRGGGGGLGWGVGGRMSIHKEGPTEKMAAKRCPRASAHPTVASHTMLAAGTRHHSSHVRSFLCLQSSRLHCLLCFSWMCILFSGCFEISHPK